MTLTRRQFFKKATADGAAAALIAASVAKLRANPLGLPNGSQVYPHRALLKDFPSYVKTMADMGVTRLELCSPLGYGADFVTLSNAKEVKKIMGDHGVKCASCARSRSTASRGRKRSGSSR